jgi:flagellar hook-associated protein 1 FlgK
MSSLNIGARALNANLAALQVIGNNIANVNTPGYSRQNVIQQTSGYQQTGSGYIGMGMELTTVERSHNAYLTREAQKAGSVAAADALRYARLQQLESAFPTGSAGLGTALNDMLNAWTDVASAPGNLTARVVVIAKGEELASRLRNTASQIDSLQHTTKQQLEGAVRTINGLAQDLAKVNERITESQGNGHTPNDLLDQRDKILGELNKYVQTTNVPSADGAVSVFIAGSQPLVLGTRANALAAGQDSTDSARIALSFVQGGVSIPVPDTSLGGGELAGLMRFMNEDLVDVQNLLGRMALATATTVNNQHKLGVDLQGNPGQNFFNPPAGPGQWRRPRSRPSAPRASGRRCGSARRW